MNKEEMLAKAKAFVESTKWTFAKTMPKTPHDWIVKQKVDPAEFDNLLACWEQFSEPKKYKGRIMQYLFIGEYQYWPMDLRRLGKEIFLMNRAESKDVYE